MRNNEGHKAMTNNQAIKTVGIAGTGAIGTAVAKAIIKGINGLKLTHVSDLNGGLDGIPNVSFDELAENCDIIIECLPPKAVPPLAERVIKAQKEFIMISGCALLMFPEILELQHSMPENTRKPIIVPSGALAGIDGIKALKELGIISSKIASTKPPVGFKGAPHIVKNNIDLTKINQKTKLFSGNAIEAAQGFPANVNVAATLSLAGIGAEKTQVEIWADPEAKGNAHEITVEGQYSKLTSKIENMPDPANPKSSMLAAQSIVSVLKDINNSVIVL
ncbi:MAG: hypothetical protein CBB87_11100 [Micavibrio sp. TMED27]|nr:aspartate dehydrogenase [Micavibrio sp.]OUT89840.1 MAG: hypothetical protein CBB87_11100 [Micavibrio sp. TMED27]